MPPQSPAETPTPAEQPVQPASPADPSQGNYEFIMNPQKPPHQPLLSGLPGVNSLALRALYIGGGLLVLLIIFIIIKGLVGGSSKLPTLVSVAQDQQAMIHLTTNAGQQQVITTSDLNFAATAQLSLSSSKTALVQYLANNGQKVKVKTLSLKISAETDKRLADAVPAGTYDQTFRAIMKDKLTAYVQDLKQAYQQTKGPKGRALLNDDYKQAQLLLVQLNSAAR